MPDNPSPSLDELAAQAAGNERPVVNVDQPLHILTDQVEQALLAAGAPIYVNGPLMLTPVLEEVEASKGRTTKVARLKVVNINILLDHMSRAADWVKITKKKTFVHAAPPREAAATLLSRSGEWRFPRVAGVICTPTMRPDGSVLNTPGYDPATRLILMNLPEFTRLPDNPTAADVQWAFNLLKKLISEFPFADEGSKAVALSALITPVVRGLFSVAPMPAINATTPGTGKSYLMDTVAAITMGRPCPTMDFGRTEEEFEKRLGAMIINGQPIISIDNMNGVLNSSPLCQAIERPVVQVRRLGMSEMLTIDNRATIYCNGNNLTVSQDLIRRSLYCRMDAKMEQPETRVFKFDPVAAVMESRHHYIAACIVIIRAYILAGRPGKLKPLASFEGWSDSVRSALVWLGCADPVASMEVMQKSDPIKLQRARVFAAWSDHIGIGKPILTKDIIQKAAAKSEHGVILHPSLNDVVVEIGAGEHPDKWPIKLGHWLRKHNGTIVNDLSISRDEDKHTGQPIWTLVKNVVHDPAESEEAAAPVAGDA